MHPPADADKVVLLWLLHNSVQFLMQEHQCMHKARTRMLSTTADTDQRACTCTLPPEATCQLVEVEAYAAAVAQLVSSVRWQRACSSRLVKLDGTAS